MRSVVLPLVNLACMLSLTPVAPDDSSKADSEPRLKLSSAVVCAKIEGFRQYDERRKAELSKDQKLLVYYEPTGHASEAKDGVYRAHLIQNGAIRRADSKTPLWKREKMIEYKPEAPRKLGYLYMQSTVSLKDLKPGDYVFEIELKDALSGATATQSVPFKVVEKDDEPDAPG